jgi:3-methylfumaryl-CoA hydratase
MSEGLDINHLRGWIGRTDTARDVITDRLVREYAATMDTVPDAQNAPLAVHWCLAPPAAAASDIGPDGHPARGGFLPPVPLPRRMWAGGQLTFHNRLMVGDHVERVSNIADVTVKEGRTGVLCFVTLHHEISSSAGLLITERQDLVYRPAAGSASGTAKPEELPPAQWRRTQKADPVLLFRFSALTFNGHRIHYDRPYAMEVENYPGLVVHGPLQASWLLNFAAEIKGAAPRQFSFRGVNPLFDFQSFALCAREADNGLQLWIQSGEGVRTMDAQAQW